MVAFPLRPRVAVGDVAALAETARPLITPWYKGYVYLFNPNDNTGTGTNIDAGTMDISVHPYWAGPARIQPMRTNLNSKQTTNDTTTRVVEFEVDYAKDGILPDVRPGHQIIVARGGNNQLLTQYQYVVTGTLNSTMAFNHTIFTEVNMEVKPHFVIGAPLYPSVDLYPSEDLFPNG
jgi:hypothetical protein